MFGVPLPSGWRVNGASLALGKAGPGAQPGAKRQLSTGRSREQSGTGEALSRAGGPGQCVRRSVVI